MSDSPINSKDLSPEDTKNSSGYDSLSKVQSPSFPQQSSSHDPPTTRKPYDRSIKSYSAQQSPTLRALFSQPANPPSPNMLTRIASTSSYGSERDLPDVSQEGSLKPRKSHVGSHSHKSARRFKYSTDDDLSEVEGHHGRNYREGYCNGLKEGRRRTTESPGKRSPLVGPSSKGSPSIRPSTSFCRNRHSHNSDFEYGGTIPSNENVGTNLNEGFDDVKKLSLSSPLLHAHSSVASLVHELAEQDENHSTRSIRNMEDRLRNELDSQDEYDEDDEGDEADNDSISSTETFTLRERQNAINITHPFGIRIWKPALYKKNRSVQRIAEGDIHSRPGKDISWSVWVGNSLWTILFGILLCVVCVISGLFCFLLFWSSSSCQYGRTFFSLGRYLLFPFGKCVQLWQDENYIWEDEGVGRTIAEYEHWQTADVSRGKLFFGPAQPDQQDSGPHTSVHRSNSVSISAPHISHEDVPGMSSDHSAAYDSSVMSSSGVDVKRKRRLFGRGKWNIGRIMFYMCFYVLLMPLLYLVSLICWFGVFSIPMAKVTTTLAHHLRRHPLALSFRPASTLKNLSSTEYSSSILLCTYRAMGIRYYKYTVDGTNIFFINLMFPVLFVIFDYFILAETLKWDYIFTSHAFIFFLSLAAVIPLAYFIGQAVASISAQTSMGMGAAINAFFSTIVEVFLYCFALDQGKGDLVEGSIVGSIFAGVLLLPGLSMCAGAIKRKTQRYNPKSAGVSSTMLLFAVIGAFAPTIFYQIYGTYELKCLPCDVSMELQPNYECNRCYYHQAPLTTGPFYRDILQPFSYLCSTLLFISYVIGLWFTLRTHAALIWQAPTVSHATPITITHAPEIPTPLPIYDPQNLEAPSVVPPGQQSGSMDMRAKTSLKRTAPKKQVTLATVDPVPISLPPPASTQLIGQEVAPDTESGGHDAPNWSRTKSTVILLGATVLYAIIAEILVDTVDVVLQGMNISAKFLGITIFALVPNTTEFLNAISFAMNGNVSLSMEIGSAYALQVCLLQIPALVFYSIWIGPLGTDIKDYMFTLIFPRWDLYMVIFCVFVFSYIYAEGKSNYFKGSILVLSYLVVMLGFYYSANINVSGIMSAEIFPSLSTSH